MLVVGPVAPVDPVGDPEALEEAVATTAVVMVAVEEGGMEEVVVVAVIQVGPLPQLLHLPRVQRLHPPQVYKLRYPFSSAVSMDR